MSGYGSYIIETFATLLCVCALAFVLLYGARRFGMGKARGAIELVGQLPLEARRSIYLVKVADRVLVVGVGEGGFTKLSELPSSSLSRPGLESGREPDPVAKLFREVLGRRGPTPPSKGTPEPMSPTDVERDPS